MSQRAIAGVVGVGVGTINRDLRLGEFVLALLLALPLVRLPSRPVIGSGVPLQQAHRLDVNVSALGLVHRLAELEDVVVDRADEEWDALIDPAAAAWSSGSTTSGRTPRTGPRWLRVVHLWVQMAA
jgi:hypothetical protein